MANQKHLDVINRGVDYFNEWREQNPIEIIDLSKANLMGAKLSKVDLHDAILNGANLQAANLDFANLNGTHLNFALLSNASLEYATLFGTLLTEADLYNTNLQGAAFNFANLDGAHLTEAILSNATITNVIISRANLSRTDFSGAKLSNVDLTRSQLINTNLSGSTMEGCRIYGISTWDIKTSGSKQKDLIITPVGPNIITVDNLEVAQFIYLLLNNEKIRDVIDTITSKMVLILGRFTSQRKDILDAIREEIRRKNYNLMPVIFDFDPCKNQRLLDTVLTLACMAKFVIVDLTDPSMIIQELTAITERCKSTPIQPIIHSGSKFQIGGYIQDIGESKTFLPIYPYNNISELQGDKFYKNVIEPASKKREQLNREKYIPVFSV